MKRLAGLLVLFPLFYGCGPKAFTDGSYDDPNRVALLDDKFNEADMQQMADTVVSSMLECPEIKNARTPPIVAVSRVVNRTEEYPDIDALTEMIRTNLSKSRKVKFVDRSAREEVDSETEYGQSGRVSRDSAIKRGKQLGINYLMNGALSWNPQQVGNDKLVYYKLTMNLVNTETTAIDCTEEKEVRKKFRKKSLGLF
jgi:penicillin-binding protein activator